MRMKYRIRWTQEHEEIVEAENEDEGIEKAFDQATMRKGTVTELTTTELEVAENRGFR